jgi:hypothetical protein
MIRDYLCLGFLAICVLFFFRLWVRERNERKRLEEFCVQQTKDIEELQKHFDALKRIVESEKQLNKRIKEAKSHEENIDIFNYIRNLNNRKFDSDSVPRLNNELQNDNGDSDSSASVTPKKAD